MHLKRWAGFRGSLWRISSNRSFERSSKEVCLISDLGFLLGEEMVSMAELGFLLGKAMISMAMGDWRNSMGQLWYIYNMQESNVYPIQWKPYVSAVLYIPVIQNKKLQQTPEKKNIQFKKKKKKKDTRYCQTHNYYYLTLVLRKKEEENGITMKMYLDTTNLV